MTEGQAPPEGAAARPADAAAGPAQPPPGYFAGIPFDSAPLALAPIQTERLILRPITDDDAADIWEYQRLDEVLRFIPWPQRTRAEGAEHTGIRAAQRTLDGPASVVFLACELAPGAAASAGRVIGDVMLRMSSVATAELEIGWVFHPDFAGRGYATEAAVAVLRLAFEGIGAHRVIAHLDPRNTASARLCERIGLVHEATLRESYWDKGEWSDTGSYGMLAREWRAIEDAPAPHTP